MTMKNDLTTEIRILNMIDAIMANNTDQVKTMIAADDMWFERVDEIYTIANYHSQCKSLRAALVNSAELTTSHKTLLADIAIKVIASERNQTVSDSHRAIRYTMRSRPLPDPDLD